MSEITPDAWKYKVDAPDNTYWATTTNIERTKKQYAAHPKVEIVEVIPLYDGKTVAQILNQRNNSAAEVLATETGRPKEDFEPPGDVEYPDFEELETHDPEEFYD